MPAFTVIMATYNRGRHILPSVHSALRQDFADFELLVIGDCCTDDTEAALQPLLGDKVRWINLRERWGSQSGPNNEGIRLARGRYVAYLGHDDIWAPDHLTELFKLFTADPELAFAVGGAIFHSPADCDYREITGIFDPGDARRHFFPPSSFAHRRNVVESVGPWRRPLEIVLPVDADFTLRAADLGLRFASTQKISVHKFSAAHRYLCYLEPSSAEQADMLERLAAPDYRAMVEAQVARARQLGTFMDIQHAPTDGVTPGQYARVSAASKGLMRPRVQALSGRTAIPQDDWPRALDWRRFAAKGETIRWAYLNPNPKLLLPYSSDAAVRLSLTLAHADPDVLQSIALRLNGHPVAASCGPAAPAGGFWTTTAVLTARLDRQRHSIIEFNLTGDQIPTRGRRGIGIGEIVLEPLA